jgi:hypothetical protein
MVASANDPATAGGGVASGATACGALNVPDGEIGEITTPGEDIDPVGVPATGWLGPTAPSCVFLSSATPHNVALRAEQLVVFSRPTRAKPPPHHARGPRALGPGRQPRAKPAESMLVAAKLVMLSWTVPAPLRREVLPPRRAASAAGALLLTTVTMVMAISASAVLLRDQLGRHSVTLLGPRDLFDEPNAAPTFRAPAPCWRY